MVFPWFWVGIFSQVMLNYRIFQFQTFGLNLANLSILELVA